MTKRLLAMLLAACLALAMLAGCGSRSEESTEEDEEPETQESSSQPGRVSAATDEEAAQINQQIREDEVNLVQFDGIGAGDTVANIYTSEGTIRIKLFPDEASKAVENFTGLVQDGFYNGITFHQVVPGTMVQAGDPDGTGNGGQSYFSTGDGDPGYFEDEPSLNMWHFRGAVAMAHAGGRRDTNNSQFYIVQRDYVTEKTLEDMKSIRFPNKVIDKYEEVGGTPHLDGEHTVFAMVADEESMAVVDRIARAANEDGVPVEPIIIESISIETK